MRVVILQLVIAHVAIALPQPVGSDSSSPA